jgi:hypothetical protein
VSQIRGYRPSVTTAPHVVGRTLANSSSRARQNRWMWSGTGTTGAV